LTFVGLYGILDLEIKEENKMKINIGYFNAVKEKVRLESYECGLYGQIKNKYRVIFCKDSKEFVTQRKFKNGWLCLHN